MNFNSNMSGTYRHYKFEQQMIEWLNEELRHGVSAIIPSRYCRIFSFFISYPNENIGNEIPELMVNKVLNNVGQYSIYDCYIISRGLNIAFINRRKKSLPIFLDHYVSIIINILIIIFIYILFLNLNFFKYTLRSVTYVGGCLGVQFPTQIVWISVWLLN